MTVKVRYKTDAKPEDEMQWRVIIEGVEHHAAFVSIHCPCFTTKDLLPSGETKWHITCYANYIERRDNNIIIS